MLHVVLHILWTLAVVHTVLYHHLHMLDRPHSHVHVIISSISPSLSLSLLPLSHSLSLSLISSPPLSLSLSLSLSPPSNPYPEARNIDHNWVAYTWAVECGLPHLSGALYNGMVDGRVLNSLTKDDIKKYLKVKYFKSVCVCLCVGVCDYACVCACVH